MVDDYITGLKTLLYLRSVEELQNWDGQSPPTAPHQLGKPVLKVKDIIGEVCLLMYCGTILIHGGVCSRIVNILLVCEDVILWVTGLLHYNARQFITLLNIHGDLNSQVRESP